MKDMTDREHLLYKVVHMIANDYVELSHDKVMWQRNDFMKRCRAALETFHSFPEYEGVSPMQGPSPDLYLKVRLIAALRAAEDDGKLREIIEAIVAE